MIAADVIATERRTMSLPVHLQSSHLPLGDQRTGRLYGKDVLSVAQFCRDDLDYVFWGGRGHAYDGGTHWDL
jgi:hypothetical protein